MDPVQTHPPMPEGNRCPHCGAPFRPGALAGLCPACLLEQGATTDTVTEPAGKAFVPPTPSDLAPLFPQLEILELIGKGGMGAVYKARQKELDRLVALKILPPGIGHDPAFAERFTREAKALARLNHPGIVTLYEFGLRGSPRAAANLGGPPADPGPAAPPVADPLYYFLMEFVDGVNLRQLLHAGRISPREALAIVPQICDALQFAHDQGIVHRDIKPENILLDRRGRVVVADFGLAKLIESSGPLASTQHPCAGKSVPASSEVRPETPVLTDAGKVMGTPKYMAPEQVEHPAEVDHRADIYALGVVFYQMLTGELPGKPIQPPSAKVQVDVRLDEVVLRALETRPELRYQQASVLKTQVETIVASPLDDLRRGDAAPTGGQSGVPPAVATIRGTRFALGVVTAYAGTVLFGCLCALIRGGVPGGWLVAVFVLLALLTSLLVSLTERITAAESRQKLMRVSSLLAAITAAPVMGFATFFFWGLAQERGGWNPAWDEAVLVPLTWLGAVLLPVCAWRLWRAAGGPGSFARAPGVTPVVCSENPLPVLDFWRALEAGDYAQAWDKAGNYLQRDIGKEVWVNRMEHVRRPLGRATSRRTLSTTYITPRTRYEQRVLTRFDSQRSAIEVVVCAVQPDAEWRIERYEIHPDADVPETATTLPLPSSAWFAALAAVALLLLTASGSALVMLIGSAVLLAIGLTWYARRAWRGILLLTLASLGVAMVVALVLTRGRPVGLQQPASPAASAESEGWTDCLRLDQVIALGGHGTGRCGTAEFQYELVFDEKAVALTASYRKPKDAPYRVQREDKQGRRRALGEGGLSSTSRLEHGYETVQEKRMLSRVEFEQTAALILQKWVGHPDTVEDTGASGRPVLASPGASAESPEVPPAVHPDLLREPPRLRFLAWQDAWKTNQLAAVWRPDGSPASNAVELAWLKHVPPAGMDVSALELQPEPHFLHMWFSHPAFDLSTAGEVALLDAAGNPVRLGARGSTASGVQAPSEENGQLGWWYGTLSPEEGTGLPTHVTVRLLYTIGPLERVQEVAPDFNGMMSLEGGGQLNGIGQNAEGRAFVSLAVDATQFQGRQFDVRALTKAGRVIPSVGRNRGGSVGGAVQVEGFTFGIPLLEVTKFRIGIRPVRTNVWNQVRLPPDPSEGQAR